MYLCTVCDTVPTSYAQRHTTQYSALDAHTRSDRAVLGDMLCSNPEDVYILSPTSQSYAQDELCVVVLLSSWCILLVADAATLEDVYSTAQHVHPPTST